MKWNTRALIPALLAAVVVMALATAWMTLRPGATETGRPDVPLDVAVVRAPPITVPNTSVSGGPPAPADNAGLCRTCGVVESVEATQGHTRFQMRIRMGDGSITTVEQASPLVAGSRVVMQGGVARPAPPGTQG